MIKRLLYVFLLLVSFRGFSQGNIPIGSPNRTVEVLGGLQVDGVLRILPRADTLITPSGPGAIVFAYSKAWMWTGTQWAQMSGIAWGTIPGTLSAQADLAAALAGKQSLINNGYGWKIVGGAGVFDSAVARKVDTVYRVNDSTIGFAVNGRSYNFLVRGTAAGASVLSIVLNTPSSIFVTPINYTSDGAGHWTGTLALANQSPNTFLAGPTSGSPAVPSFRQIGVSDLPTNIPNGYLQNSTIGLQIDQVGTMPQFSATAVALGNTIVLHQPWASPTSSGPLTSADYNRFNNAILQQVTSVNGQTGTVVTLNADSIWGYPIDITNYRNGYVMALDTVRGKLFFTPPPAIGITTLNGLTAGTQSFANGISGTSPNIASSGSTHTFNIPIENGSDTGMVTPTQFNLWNGKEQGITPSNTPNQYWNGYKKFVTFDSAGLAVAFKQGGNSFAATAILGTKDNNHLDFYTNNTQQARLTNTGNFLIGTTTDNGAKLQVNGGFNQNLGSFNTSNGFGASISIPSTANSTVSIGSTSGTVALSGNNASWSVGQENILGAINNSGYFDIAKNSTSYWRIFNNGNVAIGSTTDNGNKLQVNGNATINNISFIAGADVSSSEISYGLSGIEMVSSATHIFNAGGSAGSITFGFNRSFANSPSVRISQFFNSSGNNPAVEMMPSITNNQTTATGLSVLNIIPTWNVTGITGTSVARGIYYNPVITSLTNTRHIAIETVTGNVLFGTTSGNVIVGSSTDNGSKFQLNGSATYSAITTATDANYTSVSDYSIILPVITAARTLTLPAAASNTGRFMIIMNRNTSGTFSWSFAVAIKDAAGNNITTLANSTVYQVYSDGTNYIKVN